MGLASRMFGDLEGDSETFANSFNSANKKDEGKTEQGQPK